MLVHLRGELIDLLHLLVGGGGLLLGRQRVAISVDQGGLLWGVLLGDGLLGLLGVAVGGTLGHTGGLGSRNHDDGVRERKRDEKEGGGKGRERGKEGPVVTRSVEEIEGKETQKD